MILTWLYCTHPAVFVVKLLVTFKRPWKFEFHWILGEWRQNGWRSQAGFLNKDYPWSQPMLSGVLDPQNKDTSSLPLTFCLLELLMVSTTFSLRLHSGVPFSQKVGYTSPSFSSLPSPLEVRPLNRASGFGGSAVSSPGGLHAFLCTFTVLFQLKRWPLVSGHSHYCSTYK